MKKLNENLTTKKKINKRVVNFLFNLAGICSPFILFLSIVNICNLEGILIFFFVTSVLHIFAVEVASPYFDNPYLNKKLIIKLIDFVISIIYWCFVCFLLITSITKFACADKGLTVKQRALQREASSIIFSSSKASKAFFNEKGKLATSTKDLGEYISVIGCKTNDSLICRNSASENYSDKEITRWYTPSGNYEIEMKSDNDQNIFVATPTREIKEKGLWGVSGCFNSKNGKFNILEMDTVGTNVEMAICDD